MRKGEKKRERGSQQHGQGEIERDKESGRERERGRGREGEKERQREREKLRDIERKRKRKRGTLEERKRKRERYRDIDGGKYKYGCERICVCEHARENLEEYTSMPSVRTVNFIEDNPFNITYCVRSSVQHGAQNL